MKAGGASMFPEPFIEWSPLRIEFLSWCEFYYNIYQMPEDERPNNQVIDDDEHLETWFKNKKAERERTAREARLNKNRSSKPGGSKTREFDSSGFKFV